MSRQSSGENSIHATRAAVYTYNNESKSWAPADEGGLSRVFIFNNPEINTYRVIGITENNKYVINSPIFKKMIYQKVSDLFVQWRDSESIYGLSFPLPNDAEGFYKAIANCIAKLEGGTASRKTQPPPPPRRRVSSLYNNEQPAGQNQGFDLLTRAESELDQRERIIKEIYTTENDYVAKLTQLVEQCYHPCVNGKYRNVFSDEERKMIYGNVEILSKMNAKFRDTLLPRITSWHEQQTIGDVFLHIIPFFRVYKEYYTNYEAGTGLLAKLSKRKDVASYLKHCENVADGQKLPYLLIMPVQRIPRYTLLLTELIKHTKEDHPDLLHLQKAREQLKDFTMHANESVRETEHSKKFADILKEPKKYIGFDSLAAPHRSLVFQCDVLVKLGEKELTWLLLFSDLLVFASTSGKKYIIEEKLDLEQVWVEDLGTDKFRVVSPDKMYLVEPSPRKPLDKAQIINSFEKTTIQLLQYRGFAYSEDGKRRNLGVDYNGGRYEGEWFVAKPCGRGKMVFQSGNSYIGDFDSGRLSGNGKMSYTGGGFYEGQWLSDKPHGSGRLETPEGVYEGEFVHGLKEGNGKMIWPNEDYYEGQWVKDRMSGFGKFVSKTATYEGYWEFNMFHGRGTLEWPGGKYTGDWVYDRRSGEGEYIHPNGDTYVGSWKDNQHHGKGKFQSANGTYVYEGEWDNSRMHGSGTLTCEKFTYTGNWKDDRKSGHGVLKNADGSSYEGNWADDRREGSGVWKSPTGEVYDGYWHSDKRFGKGKLHLPDGSVYEGEWVNNRKEGKGTFIWSDGTKYSGNWMSDKRHGKGVLSAADESYKYAGEWANDYRHGTGSLTNFTGTYEGEWIDDKPHGAGKSTNKAGEVFEGTFNKGLRDGEGSLTRADGVTISIFYKDCVREKPQVDVLPPTLPPIKLITP